MKIKTAIIRNKSISVFTDNIFNAKYKGKEIYISSEHGFGKAIGKNQTRFCVNVIDIKTGMKDVDSYGDFSDIKEAIEYALNGSCIMPNCPE